MNTVHAIVLTLFLQKMTFFSHVQLHPWDFKKCNFLRWLLRSQSISFFAFFVYKHPFEDWLSTLLFLNGGYPLTLFCCHLQSVAFPPYFHWAIMWSKMVPRSTAVFIWRVKETCKANAKALIHKLNYWCRVFTTHLSWSCISLSGSFTFLKFILWCNFSSTTVPSYQSERFSSKWELLNLCHPLT